MRAELYASDELLLFKPFGEISIAAVNEWNQIFYQHYSGQLKLLMDFRQLDRVDITVSEFMSVGQADRARAQPNPGMRVAYVSSSKLIYGFARVIERVWHDSVDVSVFRDFDSAATWLETNGAVWHALELKVRAE